LVPVSLASADLKVATIDLAKAFDAFYKTKEAAQHLKEKQDEAQKEIQDKVADYQRIGDDVQKLDQESKDPTLSVEARNEKAKARDQRGADLQAAQRQIEEFKTERSNELKDEYIRRRKEVVDEITKVITDYSGPQGYDLVIDKSSASAASGVPIILYNSNKLPDITDDIIKQLNAGAPATTAATPDAAAPATH
jgi:Skp family chaperone for outer membrane proteins